MTQKEKAIELVEKYKGYVYCYIGSGMLTNDYNDSVATMNAKQCAIIAVDEIIAVTHEDPYPRPKTKMDKEYWQEVKEEIEKL